MQLSPHWPLSWTNLTPVPCAPAEPAEPPGTPPAAHSRLDAAPLPTVVYSKGRERVGALGLRDHPLALMIPTAGLQGGSPAGAWDSDRNGNSKCALGDAATPMEGPRCPPPRSPSRLSLGRRHKLCRPDLGQANNSEGIDHDYLPLVRTREVEGGAAGARRCLSSLLPPPPLSSGAAAGGTRLLPPGRALLCRCAHLAGAPLPRLALCRAPCQPQPHLGLIALGTSRPWCWSG